MLTYTPPNEQDLPQATEKPWLLLLLCLAWLLPGLLRLEPLKPDEIVISDIVRNLLSEGSWSLPMLAGEPWLERAPLFYWAAAVFAWVGQWLGLSLHEGARLATGGFMAMALWGVGLTARELVGRRHGRSGVLILIGCVGLLMPGHALNGDIAVLSAWCWGIYATALAPRRPSIAGVILGIALSACGLSGSLAEAALLLVLAILLPIFKAWRFQRYGLTLLIALALAIPLIASWALALYQNSPAAFTNWYDWYSLGFFGGFAYVRAMHPFGYYLKLLPWFAWPSWFLAGATLWMQRDRLNQTQFQLPLLAGFLTLLCLFLSDSGRSGYALLLLPPLALIGAVGLDVLRRGAASFINWFGIFTFGLLAICLWVIWSAMHLGYPARLTVRINELAPSFQAELSIAALLFGITFTLLWVWAVSRSRPMGRQAVTNWAAGITLCWGLATAFATDWVNARTSYRDFAHSIANQLPTDSCISSENLQSNQRAALHYYLGLQTDRREVNVDTNCRWLLRQGGRESLSVPEGWQEVWQGGRPGDRNERYYLYRKNSG
ncbi:ArnT family glycosyltransferase [Chitinimonas sp. PSY-7]|uniref:ArnT family glycosyltransferase n=1 Tax=Chitinimonas sp. PSY-7 TaxID=3459088 RepID=UPI00403FE621